MNFGMLRLRVAAVTVVMGLGLTCLPSVALAVPTSAAEGGGASGEGSGGQPSGDGGGQPSGDGGSHAEGGEGAGGTGGNSGGGNGGGETVNINVSDSHGNNQPMARPQSNLMAKINTWMAAREMASARVETVQALMIAPVFIVEPTAAVLEVQECTTDCVVISLY